MLIKAYQIQRIFRSALYFKLLIYEFGKTSPKHDEFLRLGQVFHP